MAFRLTWSPAARCDLRDIFAYIAKDDRAAAGKFVHSVVRAVERLPAFPESGRMVPEFGDPAIREVVRRPCRIVYRVNAGRGMVEIARVWHAARGIPEVPRSDN